MDRRRFIRQTTAAGVGLGLANAWPTVLQNRHPSEVIRVAVMGVNGRGSVLATEFARRPDCIVRVVCDVDSRAAERVAASLVEGPEPLSAERPRIESDFRRVLDDISIDAVVIAAPDHWHATAAVLAMRAGKAVYVEKPCGTTPAEGDLLAAVQKETGIVVQMGNQQRSAPPSIELVGMIRDGIIGRPYLARTWYANARGSIGHGNVVSVPEWLDYDMWQGPAPRTPYRDNTIHYNWHWFRRWGTGEICNNGTHEIDVARWALGVDFPIRVVSSGGRYHFDDDWEFTDTQIASFEFAGGMQITWEGRSCNPLPVLSRGRGTAIHGTEGTAIVDRSGYIVMDLENHEIARRIVGESGNALDTRGSGDLTDTHVINFLDAMRGTDGLNAPIGDASRSVLLCHLGNIAQETGRALRCDPDSGRILDDPGAMSRWARTYEPGWEINSL